MIEALVIQLPDFINVFEVECDVSEIRNYLFLRFKSAFKKIENFFLDSN